MQPFEKCSRGFTLRLLREYRAETRAMHALHCAAARAWGKQPRTYPETCKAFARAHAQHHARQWTDTQFG